MAMRYARNADVIKIEDGVSSGRVGRSGAERTETSSARNPILDLDDISVTRVAHCHELTGGLGSLGLSVAQWMVTQGARRILLLSRRSLPPRSTWTERAVGCVWHLE
jgi:6-methylsalicylic acid synthase